LALSRFASAAIASVADGSISPARSASLNGMGCFPSDVAFISVSKTPLYDSQAISGQLTTPPLIVLLHFTKSGYPSHIRRAICTFQ
jgi:hypothetical protein